MLHSLADIAKDTIARKNPFPKLEGFNAGIYVCKWGLTDLYPEEERILRDAIENRKTFDTGWVDCKKEIRSFRMISDGTVLTIQACSSMDDFDDLIYDAAPDGTEFSDEQIEELTDYWNDSMDLSTDAEAEATVPVTTYKEAIGVLGKLEAQNEKSLDSCFQVVQSWVSEILAR
jgi:hypothetical protein